MMERWIAVAVNPETGQMSFLQNAGGDQQTARNWTARNVPKPPAGCWVGCIPFDVVFIGDQQYEGPQKGQELPMAAWKKVATHEKELKRLD